MTRMNHFRTLAALVAAALLALVLAGGPAGAAFPGSNNSIVFASNRTTGTGVNNPTGDAEIFTMNPDGTNILQLTFNTAGDSSPAFSADGTRMPSTATSTIRPRSS
jgi:hypothetical protein